MRPYKCAASLFFMVSLNYEILLLNLWIITNLFIAQDEYEKYLRVAVVSFADCSLRCF